MRIPSLASVLCLAGCMEAAGPDGHASDLRIEGPHVTEDGTQLLPALPDQDDTASGGACDPAQYDRFIGKTPAEVDAAGLGIDYRLLMPGSVATADYNPMRVNFQSDETGLIYQVSCG